MFYLDKKKLKNLIDVKAAEAKLREEGKQEVEKGDILAITIAAFRVFFPAILCLAGGFLLVGLLFSR